MNRSLVRPAMALLLWSLYFCTAAPALAQARPATLAELALDQSENRLERLIEGAKKEGELTLYSSMTAEDQQIIIDAFTKKYGVKIKLWRSGSEAVVQRVVAEARAGRTGVDVADNNVPEMEALRLEKLLQKVNSPTYGDLRPEAVPAHREWIGNTIDIFLQGYNTTKVRKEDLPKTYYDLLHPRWKGSLGIEAADQHWFAAVLAELGHEKGMKLFKDIVDTNGMSVRKGHMLLANLVASAEVPLGLTLYSHAPATLKKKGAPIEAFIIPPYIGQFRSAGVMKTAPHPHAALLYAEFLISEDGQKIFADIGRVPTSIRLDTPWSKVVVKFIDPVDFLDKNVKWIRDFEEAVTKRAK